MLEKLKNNKWFSLIELIVVVSIISIISVTWVWYFWSFLDEQSIKTDLNNIESKITDLDFSVRNKEIFDYEINFNTWSLLFVYEENKFDNENIVLLDLDNFSWTWIISTSSSSTWILWQSKLYKWNKMYLDNFYDSQDSYDYVFNDNLDYKITWYFNQNQSNKIYIQYYSEENLDKKKQSYLILDSINTKEDKSWNNYSWIIYKNINNKKYIESNLWDNLEEVYLFFEKNGQELFLKLEK